MKVLKGILKIKLEKLEWELKLLNDSESMEHSKYTKLETKISTLNEVIDIIDTL
jgi:chaperonin cofactor prefoldin